VKVGRLARIVLLGACLGLLALSLGPAAWAKRPLAYTILPGDTLPGIAARYGIPLDALLRAHGLSLSDTLYAGDTLLLPLAPVAERHTVAPGETLPIIAARYGVATTQIAWRNGLADPQRLTAGKALVIPDVTGEALALETALVWPVAGQRVQGAVRVSGWGQSYDNELVLRIQAADGTVVAEGRAAIHAEIGQLGAFATTLRLPGDMAPAQALLLTVLRRERETGGLAPVESLPVVSR